MGALILTIILLGAVGFIVYYVVETAEESKEEYRRTVDDILGRFNAQKQIFDNCLSSFFLNNHSVYWDTFSNLDRIIKQMQEINNDFTRISKRPDDNFTNEIYKYAQLASGFFGFGKKVNQLPYTEMMDASNYGRIQKEYWDKVHSLSKNTADIIISNCEQYISSKNYWKIFAIDIEVVLRCIWFYATENIYSDEAYKKAVSVFDHLVEKPHIDVTIAELYAMKQLGGEAVLRERIRNMLKTRYATEELTLIASSLMWINAYQTENMILQHMLLAGMQMTVKAQERLRSLTNGGGNAPSVFKVYSNANSIYFDVSALAWKDDEYTGLFENLAFQEKILSYSLAVRDEDKDLYIAQGISIPDINVVLRKLNAIFAEEYGNSVTASLKNCIALSGSGEEKMESILVEANECKQMGILVHVVHIGKKLNIKFYTLFMPGRTGLATQKQQVLSLYKKLSHSVAIWESSMKDTVLMAIQQLLNTETQGIVADSAISADNDAPFF